MQEDLKSYIDDLRFAISVTEEVLAKDVMYDVHDLARLDWHFYLLAKELKALRDTARSIQRGE